MSSNLKLVVPAIAAGTIAVGGAAAYYFLKVQPAQDVANPLSSFEVLSKDTVAAGYLSFDEDSWDQASQFGTPEARDFITQQWSEFKTNLEKNPPSGQEISFDEDIKPWLGSVTVAGVMEPDSTDLSLVLVVGIKDKVEALKFAVRQKDDAAEKATVSKFEGVDIYEFKDTTTQYLALLDNHLVLSDQKERIESAITVEKSGDSILKVNDIQQALSQSMASAKPVAVGFANPSSIIDQVLNSASSESFGEQRQILEDLKQYKAISGSWSVEDQGFRFKNVLKHELDQEWQFDPLPGKVVSKFPDNTLALIHSGYLQQSWNLIAQELEKDSNAKAEFEQFQADFKRNTQLDLSEDLLSWMDGEFGFGLIPANDGLLSQIGFGGAIAIQTSDRPKAENTLNKLNDLARSGGAEVKQSELGGVAMTQWGIPLQSSLINYGWLDDSTLLFAVGESTASTITQGPASSIQNNDIYKKVTGSLGNPDRGFLFINPQAMLSTARSSPAVSTALAASPEVDASFGSLEGIAVAGSQPDQNTVVGEALITFTQQ